MRTQSLPVDFRAVECLGQWLAQGAAVRLVLAEARRYAPRYALTQLADAVVASGHYAKANHAIANSRLKMVSVGRHFVKYRYFRQPDPYHD